ncbi:isoaspartyl peptidase/L-asparaginase [Hymenobacter sp. BT175]|uniref:isoaspartyl peptidase/L-asparaginase family protein n=1 Tax=Hymenobacter translucens TaxID=2886507 RepID=UPI001D0E1E6D|nr:isoaspartyl peptidase/L-asparaginase [Hymenobacter translucens]MCC2546888.1 isoaspartyl peptidase/L-asparaginase [Hymenobacter translucens]
MRNLGLSFLFLLLTTALSAQGQPAPGTAKPDASRITLVIHGGAGTITRANMTPEKEKAYQEKLNEALQVGYAILKKGGTSLDAVEATVRVMEDSPLFNAGKGAVFTHEGRNELDAAIMDGKTGKAGAVAGITVVRNPISAARAVMEKSEHVMMVGPGAEQFAREKGLEIVEPAYFYTEARHKQWETAVQKDKSAGTADQLSAPTKAVPSAAPVKTKVKVKIGKPQSSVEDQIFTEGRKFGTVGAVALDQYGNLAAATSTGGMTNKRYGRVGDAPIIGAGTYADNAACAVSATGHGEFFIRYAVAHDIAARMQYKGQTVQQAAGDVVLKKLVELGGEGGVIALDREGNFAMPFNSEGMYRGYIKANGQSEVLIYK